MDRLTNTGNRISQIEHVVRRSIEGSLTNEREAWELMNAILARRYITDASFREDVLASIDKELRLYIVRNPALLTTGQGSEKSVSGCMRA